MKKLLSIALIMFVLIGSIFAEDELFDAADFENDPFDAVSSEEEAIENLDGALLAPTNDEGVVPPGVDAVEKNVIFIDQYFTANILVGKASSPVTADTLYTSTGAEFNFYKYWGIKHYGLNLKLTALGEDYQYGSYQVAFNGSMRYNLMDNLDLFFGAGPALMYYGMMDSDAGSVSYYYGGVNADVGIRLFPFEDNSKLAFDLGASGSYLWNIPIGSSSGAVSTRYQATGFVGFSYIFATGKKTVTKIEQK
jgi:hypothetical protein